MFAQRSGLPCAARPRRSIDVARGMVLVLSLLAVVTAFFPGRVRPADKYWDANAGNWSDANCWTAGEPDAGTSANISKGGTATITQAGKVCRYLYLGHYGTGTLNVQNGGVLGNSLLASLAWRSNSSGAVTVDGNGPIWTNNRELYVGPGTGGSPACGPSACRKALA